MVFGSKSLPSKRISQIRLDRNKIKKKKKKQDQNRVEEEEERKKKKRKKLTMEQNTEIQARLGGVGVRACGVLHSER